MSPLPSCESSKLYLWCPHHSMASSAPVLSDESAPTFPFLHLLPLLSPQGLMSLYCWFSFISKSTALLRLPVSRVAYLAAFQSLPISGTWPGQPFLSPPSLSSPGFPDIWNEAPSSVIPTTRIPGVWVAGRQLHG